MAWVAPRTYVAGAVLTAAHLNETRDSLKAIGDAWGAYVPAWTSNGTAPALGNGTLVGSYMQAGKLVHFRMQLTTGSTSTYGTGTYRFSLPVASVISTINHPVGTSGIVDASASAAYLGIAILVTSSTMAVLHQSAAGASASAGQTSPMTFATGDQLYVSGTYEAA